MGGTTGLVTGLPSRDTDSAVGLRTWEPGDEGARVWREAREPLSTVRDQPTCDLETKTEKPPFSGETGVGGHGNERGGFFVICVWGAGGMGGGGGAARSQGAPSNGGVLPDRRATGRAGEREAGWEGAGRVREGGRRSSGGGPRAAQRLQRRGMTDVGCGAVIRRSGSQTRLLLRPLRWGSPPPPPPDGCREPLTGPPRGRQPCHLAVPMLASSSWLSLKTVSTIIYIFCDECRPDLRC